MRRMAVVIGRILTAATVAAAMPAGAEEGEGAVAPPPSPGLALELNGLQPTDGGCRLTFVIVNGLGDEVTQASFEMALFDPIGFVDRLTVLDFRDLPEGKTKVSRFDIPGAECDRISRVLVNDVTECAGGPGVDAAACRRGLVTTTRADIVFGS